MATETKAKVSKAAVEKLAKRLHAYASEWFADQKQSQTPPWFKQSLHTQDRYRFVARRLIEEGL